jgi:hypothetical protein
LPVPNPDGLIVRAGQYPRQGGVELNSTNVVQVPEEGENTATELIVPNLKDKDKGTVGRSKQLKVTIYFLKI